MLIKAKPADNTYLIPMFLNNYFWSWMCYVIWHTIFPVDWYYFISRIVHATCTDCRSTENGGEGNIISTGPYHDPMAVCLSWYCPPYQWLLCLLHWRPESDTDNINSQKFYKESWSLIGTAILRINKTLQTTEF